MFKIKSLLRWRFITPLLILIITTTTLFIIFKPFKTSSRVDHSLETTKLSSIQTVELYCEDLYIHEDLILIAELGVSFMNISDPLNPTIINRFYDGGGAHELFLRDNLLFVADHSHGMEILDITDVNNIIKITNVPVSENTAGIDVSNNLAFITAPEGLFIYNISNPSSPQMVYFYSSNKPFSYIKILDDLAFICTSNKIEVLDVSDPFNPTKLSEIGSFGFIRKFQIVGNLLYGANIDRGVEVYDISNIKRPKLLGRFHDGGSPAYIHVVDYIAYVADYEDGLEIIDVSNLSKMVEIGQFHETEDYIRAAKNVGNLVYIFDASSHGLEIIELE